MNKNNTNTYFYLLGSIHNTVHEFFKESTHVLSRILPIILVLLCFSMELGAFEYSKSNCENIKYNHGWIEFPNNIGVVQEGNIIFDVSGGGDIGDVEYFLTNTYGVILKKSSLPSFLNISSGTYNVYSLNYSDTVIGNIVGANINNITGSCFSLSEARMLEVLPPAPVSDCTVEEGNITFDVSTSTGTGTTKYLLTDASGKILEISLTNTFTGISSGNYIVYSINYSTPLSNLVGGVEVQNLQGTCYDLSLGVPLKVCPPSPVIECTVYEGNITFDTTPVSGTEFITYILTDENGIIITTSNTPSFSNITNGNYIIYAVGYNGTINGIQEGESIIEISGNCYDLSLGNSIKVCACEAQASTLDIIGNPFCKEMDTDVDINFTDNGDGVIPVGYELVYILTSGTNLVIEQVSNTPDFTIPVAGDYTIHTLVAELSDNTSIDYLDVSNVVLGVTLASEIEALLISGGGLICGDLNVEGVPIQVYNQPSLTIEPTVSVICENDDIILQATGPTGTYDWVGEGLTSTTGNQVIANVNVAGDYTYTVLLTDVNGCTNSASAIIVVNPNLNPNDIDVPESILVSCPSEVPTATDITVEYNGEILISPPAEEIILGNCPNNFTLIRTWKFYDACNNEVSVSQTIEVNDDTAPNAPAAPADITLECADAIPTGMDLSATDNCDGVITASPVDDITPGACPNQYTIVRTWTFTDGCGNETVISQTIEINDDTAPVAPAAPADVNVECSENVPAPITLTAQDNCDGPITVTPTENVIPGGCPNAYTLIRTWTFTDICGNTTSIEQTINVGDATPPVLVGVPDDVTIILNNGETVPPVPDVTATDNCAGIGEPTYEESQVVIECGYEITRIWSIIDDCENEARDTQIVTVINNVEVDIDADDLEACINQVVQLDAMPSAGTGAYTHNWSVLPNTAIISDTSVEDPTFISNTPGTYVLEYTVTDETGCTASEDIIIVVTPSPNVTITPVDPVCVGTDVTLNAVGNSSFSYEWNGDNLASTTGQSVVVNTTGMIPGQYTYTVTVTDTNGCTNTTSTNIQINDNPVVTIDPVDPVCQGTGFDLTASSVANGSYNWSGLGLLNTTGQTVSAANSLAPGTYDYSVTVTDPNGCTGTATTTVVVNPNPVVIIEPVNDICEYESATLVANGPAGTYEWSGDGLNTNTGSTVTASGLTAGTYDYTVTMTDANGCSATATTALVVNPAAVVTITPVDPTCEGNDVTLVANGPAGTYTWSGDNLSSTTGTTVTATGLTAGTYDYTVNIIDANGCEGSDMITVTILETPVVIIDPVAPVCMGTGFDLTASALPGATYEWSGIGLNSTSGQTVSVSGALAAGTYDYSVTVTAADGCEGSATTTVVVNPNPVISIDPAGDICEYESATLVANGPAGTYAWSGDGLDATTGTTVAVSDLAAGNYDYTVTMTDANGCTSTASTTLTVNPTPVVSIEPLDAICELTEVTLTATGSNGIYEWSGTGLTSTNGQSVTANGLTEGSYDYTVTITDANGCTNTAETTLVVNGTPVVEIDATLEQCYRLYSNGKWIVRRNIYIHSNMCRCQWM
ncbi:hypothetical protein AB832_04770 [Flavobacteriaceae bacterium (ex Bugula neritina AB1)]|nr:hypothetical protein AB832_04770 [Flavobacteriaceae bacterium (ex Bugula neritina AB1)]